MSAVFTPLPGQSRSAVSRTRTLVSLAMLCAVSYVVMYLSSLIPFAVIGFLKFDFKDVIIAIGGFLFGPLPAVAISVIVSFFEMISVSSTGPVGLLMNVIASCAFACPAAILYKRRRSMSAAVLGLAVGVAAMTGMMILWNYLISPLYMGVTREAVAALLVPAFLPFNLLKAGMNMALTLLLYKPVVLALRKARLVPEHENAHTPKRTSSVGVLLVSLLAFATCVLLALVLTGVI